MGLEASATYIDSLVQTNPNGAVDPASELDDHIRLIKGSLLRTFPNITGEVSASAAELNMVVGLQGNLYGELVSYRTATLTQTNETSMTADPQLTIDLSFSGNYILDFTLRYKAEGTTGPHGKFMIGAVGETLQYTVAYGQNVANEGLEITSSSTLTLDTAGTASILRMNGYGRVAVTTPPVTVQVHWAQLSACASGTSMLYSSFLRVVKVT